MSVAYWISPKGEIIDVKIKHINTIISNPEKFGFTIEFIEYVYNYYNERIGQEGKAREQLMMSLFNQFWIRLRRYKQFWSINVKKLSGRQKSYIYQWSKKILKGIHGYKELDPYIPVKIDQKNKKIKTTDVKTISKSENFISENLLIECDIKDIDNLNPYPIVNDILTYGIKRKTFN